MAAAQLSTIEIELMEVPFSPEIRNGRLSSKDHPFVSQDWGQHNWAPLEHNWIPFFPTQNLQWGGEELASPQPPSPQYLGERSQYNWKYLQHNWLSPIWPSNSKWGRGAGETYPNIGRVILEFVHTKKKTVGWVHKWKEKMRREIWSLESNLLLPQDLSHIVSLKQRYWGRRNFSSHLFLSLSHVSVKSVVRIFHFWSTRFCGPQPLPIEPIPFRNYRIAFLYKTTLLIFITV